MLFTAIIFCLLSSSSAVSIESSRYKGIVISFSSAVGENEVRLEKLKFLLSKSSEYLFHATRRRAYFSEFTFVLPSSWGLNFCKKDDNAHYIPITSPTSVYIHGNSLAKSQHSSSCGEKGDIIYIPLSWLNENLDIITGYSRVFVNLWATYRYGVFEENSITTDECYTLDGIKWSPAGCYDINATVEWELNEEGLPRCHFDEHFLPKSDMKSSVMYDTRPPNMTEFCDGSSYPHDPVMPTQHNILCDGLPVWKVIENTEDFIYGNNPSQNPDFSLPEPTFKCYHEAPLNLYISIQDVSVKDIADIMTEIRYVFLRFLLYNIPNTSKVKLFTYGKEKETDLSSPHILDLSNEQGVIDLLKEYVRISDHVSSVCIPCGIKKLVQVANESEGVNVIIFVALVSDLKLTSSLEMWEQLKQTKQKFHLILIQDTASESIPVDIVDAVHRVGGSVFSVPSSLLPLNSGLNMILSQLYKSPLHVEHEAVVVHHKTFQNIESSFSDKFSVSAGDGDKLVYTLKCNDIDRVKSESCATVNHLTGGAYDCSLNTEMNSTSHLEFKYQYYKSPKNLTCVSLATVLHTYSRSNKITLRAWLSTYVVNSKKDALTIYAEVLHSFESSSSITVEAEIYHITLNSTLMISIDLRDNGNGDPDTKKGDGIYSRYLPFKFKKGMYSVMVTAKEDCVNSLDDGTSHSAKCSQIVQTETFFVTNDFQELDIYPPNRIADLKILEVNHENSTVKLQWTAPGNDYDYGQAEQYEIKFSTDYRNLTNADIDFASSFDQETSQMNTKPSKSGAKEVKMFFLPYSEEDMLYFAALRSINSKGKYSKMSNVVQFFVKGTEKQTTITSTAETTVFPGEDNITVITDNVVDNFTYYTDDSTDYNSTVTTVLPTDITTVKNESNIDSSCIDKNYFIMMAASIGGSCLLLIIIINIILWVFCIKKHRRSTERDLMLPPHNMNIMYKENARNQVSNSTAELSGFSENSPGREPQTFPLHENLTSAVINANRLRLQNNNNYYGDYREIQQQTNSNLPTYSSVYETSVSREPHPDYSDGNLQNQSNTLQSSASSDKGISVDELGVV